MQELDLSRAFQLIEPGPVVLVVTSDGDRPNIMTMSWHMVLDFTPRIACVIGSWDHSQAALRTTGECVLAIPAADMAEAAVDIGNCSGRDTDKFERFGLTRLPAAEVRVPLIAECLANIECLVVDDALVERYDMWVLEGVHAWIDPDRKERRTIHANGDGTFVADGRTLDLRKRMTKWQSII